MFQDNANNGDKQRVRMLHSLLLKRCNVLAPIMQYVEAHADSFCAQLNASKPTMFNYKSAFVYSDGFIRNLCSICHGLNVI